MRLVHVMGKLLHASASETSEPPVGASGLARELSASDRQARGRATASFPVTARQLAPTSRAEIIRELQDRVQVTRTLVGTRRVKEPLLIQTDALYRLGLTSEKRSKEILKTVRSLYFPEKTGFPVRRYRADEVIQRYNAKVGVAHRLHHDEEGHLACYLDGMNDNLKNLVTSSANFSEDKRHLRYFYMGIFSPQESTDFSDFLMGQGLTSQAHLPTLDRPAYNHFLASSAFSHWERSFNEHQEALAYARQPVAGKSFREIFDDLMFPPSSYDR